MSEEASTGRSGVALSPLSDQSLADALKDDGVSVARRTVTKYREELKILPSHLRKQR